MKDEAIASLLESYRQYDLPASLVEKEFMLALIESDDPMFLLKVPEPFLSHIVDFGLNLEAGWHSISNNGVTDLSEHVPKLRQLIASFVREVPVGRFIRWGKNGDA